MEYRRYKALVKQFGGTVEHVTGEEYIVRFPSVFQREQFERALQAQ